MLALINKICLRLVMNANPTSSNVIISDDSGAGKDWITKKVCELLVPKSKYHHRTDISEKLLNYWTIKETGGFDGHVIHMEDPAPERIKAQAFKVRASGQNEHSFVEKGKPKHIHIEGKPVMIVTSLQATIDIEGIRRWDSLGVDKTMRTTELMKELYAKIEAGLLDNTQDTELQKILTIGLKRVKVKIPYALSIAKLLPNKLIIRTQIQKLFDYIKSSAALHQYQRETDEDGYIIANMFDYDYACFCFVMLGDVFGMALNKYEKEILDALSIQDSLTISELSNRVTLGKSALYGDNIRKGYIDTMKEKGLLSAYTTTNEQNRMIDRYSVDESIAMSFSLKTSQHMNTDDKTFYFKNIIDAINKIRKEHVLPPIKYSDENGITISFMENMKNKLDDKKGLDSWVK